MRRMVSRASGIQGKRSVKVHLPGAQECYDVVDIVGNMKAGDIIGEVLKRRCPPSRHMRRTDVTRSTKSFQGKVNTGRRSLPSSHLQQCSENTKITLLKEIFELQINDADKSRLGLMENVLDFGAEVESLNVKDLWLRQKVYADDPKIEEADEECDSKEEAEKKGAPNLDSFMFDDFTAGRYKEFKVVKTNGTSYVRRRQNRTIGIDNVKISNLLGRNKKKHRLISTVKNIEFVKRENTRSLLGEEADEADDYCKIKIEFWDEEKRESDTWEIEAQDVLQSSEIVAKVRYLMKKNKQRKLLAELRGGLERYNTTAL